MISQHSQAESPKQRTAQLAAAMQNGLEARKCITPAPDPVTTENPRVEEEPQPETPKETESTPVEPPTISKLQKIHAGWKRQVRRLADKWPFYSRKKAERAIAHLTEDMQHKFNVCQQLIARSEQRVQDLEIRYQAIIASERQAFHEAVVGRKVIEEPHVVSEQSMEALFVHSHLPKPPARVLVFGCAQSKIALELASLGFEVVGVDDRPSTLRHPRLTTIQIRGDQLPVASDSFDMVVAPSAIECTKLSKPSEPAETPAMTNEVLRALRRGGQFLLTAPFETPQRTSIDWSLMAAITRPFHVHETSFALETGGCWNIVSGGAMSEGNIPAERTQTIILIAMEKG